MWENYEEFTEQEKEKLSKYVTSISDNIFALRNLPEVIKGALFSRYSRSSLGLRSLLLKEFIGNEEASLETLEGGDSEVQLAAIAKAQNFYDRILDGYGDDSIGELGGTHMALENITMLAAKVVQDSRIGGSPLEKSTRYVYFDQKQHGEYLFYRDPTIMTSAYRDIYIDMCNHLFQVYSQLIPELTEVMEERFPRDPETSKGAYAAAVRAKVLDCLRGLLPASALTNMGVFGNGRFFEGLLQKLQCENLSEMQEIGKRAYGALSKVVPSFVRRSEATHRHFLGYQTFKEKMGAGLKSAACEHKLKLPLHKGSAVRLVSYDEEGAAHVAAALLFPHSNASLADLNEYCKSLDAVSLGKILDSGAVDRSNRRHKSPRALEKASFTFEIVADFGVYRDLQRHRMLTQDRQLLTCDLGYYIPPELVGTSMEAPYREAMERAQKVFEIIAKELPEEAQYVVPMAYNIRWYFHINLRALQWLCELRSTPQGHPGYRRIAQAMAHQTFHAIPAFERFFKFVDFEGYELGRLDQEMRNEKKKQELAEVLDG